MTLKSFWCFLFGCENSEKDNKICKHCNRKIGEKGTWGSCGWGGVGD